MLQDNGIEYSVQGFDFRRFIGRHTVLGGIAVHGNEVCVLFAEFDNVNAKFRPASVHEKSVILHIAQPAVVHIARDNALPHALNILRRKMPFQHHTLEAWRHFANVPFDSGDGVV